MNSGTRWYKFCHIGNSKNMLNLLGLGRSRPQKFFRITCRRFCDAYSRSLNFRKEKIY